MARRMTSGTPEEEGDLGRDGAAPGAGPVDPLSTSVAQRTIIDFEIRQLIENYHNVTVPGQGLIDQTFEQYIYSQKYLGILRHAVRRNFDYAFAEFEKVDPDMYKPVPSFVEDALSRPSLHEIVNQNPKAVEKQLQERVVELEQLDINYSENPEELGLTKEKVQELQRYRQFRENLITTDNQVHNNKYTIELGELQEAKDSCRLLASEEEANYYIKSFTQLILARAEQIEKGDTAKQIEASRLIDENAELNRIVDRELGVTQGGATEKFIGQTYEDHVYQEEHIAILEDIGKRLNLTYDDKSIEALFEENPQQAQELVQATLAGLREKDAQLRAAGNDPRKAGFNNEEYKQVGIYRAYAEHVRYLDELKAEGRLLKKKASPRHFASYMAKLRAGHDALLSSLREGVCKLADIGEIPEPSSAEWLEYLPGLFIRLVFLQKNIRLLARSMDAEVDALDLQAKESVLEQLIATAGRCAKAISLGGLVNISDTSELAQTITNGQKALGALPDIYAAAGVARHLPIQTLVDQVKTLSERSESLSSSDSEKEKAERELTEAREELARVRATLGSKSSERRIIEEELRRTQTALSQIMSALRAKGYGGS